MDKRGGHAVVLGASMGGLLAARVLADFYDRVTVVERDLLPSDPVNRRGVPQGRLIHAALARCTQVLDELFPGFVDELEAAGVGCWDDGDFSKVLMSAGGHQAVRSGRAPNPTVIYFPSRALLEWNVRRRVQSITNVMFLEGHDVLGLTATPDRGRVTGARVVDRAADRQTRLTADLVIDATGRGSRTPVFLEELGYGRPREDELTVQLAYACQLLRVAPGAVKEHMIALFPDRSGRRCSGSSGTKTTPGCSVSAAWRERSPLPGLLKCLTSRPISLPRMCWKQFERPSPSERWFIIAFHRTGGGATTRCAGLLTV
ncbi:MAG TPA: hypothetical protein VLL82_09865 [Mycobacterium sp.]|nr:hypothetical protein [Mycobacterium sp.]